MFNPDFKQSNFYSSKSSYQRPSDRLDRVETCTDTVLLTAVIDACPSVMFGVDELYLQELQSVGSDLTQTKREDPEHEYR